MTAKDTNIRVVLVGGSGYTGFELARWLTRHPNAEIVGVFGRQVSAMEDFHPLLASHLNLRQEAYDIDTIAAMNADIVMLCVPHKTAMEYVPALRKLGLRIVDWSADYRLADHEIYEQWYCPHTDIEGLKGAVYGLPEFYANDIKAADLVANPGCYPTCSVLALAPVLAAGLIKPNGIIVNAISGVTGAGRTPDLKYHYPECNENFMPYGVGTHRHMPEMEQVLQDITGDETSIIFQPHLCPMDRGMLCTIYADPADDSVTQQQLHEALLKAYADKPFVRVRTDKLPATKYVATTNFCDVSAAVAKGKVILFSAIDNVIKGASGQAIQNMNLMFGLDETTGLF